MTRTKAPPVGGHPSPSRHQGSAEIAAVVDRTAPAVLELLADGVPRPRAAVVAALAGRHAKEDVVRTLMRLAVTGRVEETGGRYTPAEAPGPGPGPDAG
jgi:hypothetical protein